MKDESHETLKGEVTVIDDGYFKIKTDGTYEVIVKNGEMFIKRVK